MVPELLSTVVFFLAESTCLANNVYYEARNQPIEGQLAVAKVTLNRAESEIFPDSACAVVNQKHQFSWVNQQDLPPTEGIAWDQAKIIALTAYISEDPTKGATHFHASYVKPKWANKLERKTQIGDHIFYD